MLRTRLITAALGIPVVVAIVWVGGWWLTGLVAVAATVAVLEIAAARGILRSPMAVTVGVLTFALAVAAKLGGAWPDRTVTALAIAPIALLALSKSAARTCPTRRWWSVATALYIGWLASRFIPLRLIPDGRYWVFSAPHRLADRHRRLLRRPSRRQAPHGSAHKPGQDMGGRGSRAGLGLRQCHWP